MNVEKIRQLEEIPVPPPLPFLHPKGLSTDSSMGPATPIDASYKPSKPKLKGPLELQLIQTHNDVTRISKNAMKVNANQIDRHNVEFQKITDRHIDALQQSADAAQSSQSWSHLQQFGGLVLGIANIGTGTYLLSQNNGSDTAGILLIAAGVTALSGVALDKYLHTDDKQGILPIALPIVLAMLSLALSIITIRYNTNMPEIKDILDLFQMAMGTILAAGKPYLEFVKTSADMKLISVQKDLFLKEESIKNLFEMIQTLMREFERITRVVKRTTRYTINQSIPA